MVQSTTTLAACALCWEECGERCPCPCHGAGAQIFVLCAWCPPPAVPPPPTHTTHGICRRHLALTLAEFAVPPAPRRPVAPWGLSPSFNDQ
jgi:hypothetical protein